MNEHHEDQIIEIASGTCWIGDSFARCTFWAKPDPIDDVTVENCTFTACTFVMSIERIDGLLSGEDAGAAADDPHIETREEAMKWLENEAVAAHGWQA